jgi:membrane protein required for colicin V production
VNGFDYAVLAVLAFSLLVGVLRGLVKELVMLSGWIAAFLLATILSSQVAKHMPASLGPVLGQLLAFVAVFVCVLIVAGFAGLLLSTLTRSAGLGLMDRTLGACFGVVRGVLVVLAAVLVAGLTPLPQEVFWKNAVLSGPFETAVVALRPFLPDDMARRIKYR